MQRPELHSHEYFEFGFETQLQGIHKVVAMALSRSRGAEPISGGGGSPLETTREHKPAEHISLARQAGRAQELQQ